MKSPALFSAVIVRPNSMHLLSQISDRLERRCRIARSVRLQLTEPTLRILYPDFHGPVWEKSCNIMLAGECEFTFVTSLDPKADAIETVLDVCGRKTKPSENPPGTIRYDLASHKPVEFKGIKIYGNLVHRPRDLNELGFMQRVYCMLATTRSLSL